MVHGPFTKAMIETQPCFGFLLCFQELSPPAPVEGPEGMGLSREHDSRFSLHEWGA